MNWKMSLLRSLGILVCAICFVEIMSRACECFFVIRLSWGRMTKKWDLLGSQPGVAAAAQPDPGLFSFAPPGLGLVLRCFLQSMCHLQLLRADGAKGCVVRCVGKQKLCALTERHFPFRVDDNGRDLPGIARCSQRWLSATIPLGL
jgi:hypothetical protein